MPLDLSSVTAEDLDRFKDRARKRHKRTLLGSAANLLGGAVGGAAAAGTVAGAAEATTLLGSTTLASALGGVFVASTPIGWTVGAAIAGAAVAGLAGKTIKSGISRDHKNKALYEDK
ncbi:hypothetical protein LF599_02565 [Pseudodesulfovibrio thermohalotolerans]|uniref:hypothetical protein n=1 Tax=Pseudodesulfovibrio thermohalotolerans TaxID=2880651 RepID=UPI0022BA05B0|nr:hypothetical protein [Pseudodesulfovibrio thermohalotolerans]WFS63060.1 hypothetical protein LF599_02565 [Pseudodesulfovibrio thermohalotolerans]